MSWDGVGDGGGVNGRRAEGVALRQQQGRFMELDARPKTEGR